MKMPSIRCRLLEVIAWESCKGTFNRLYKLCTFMYIRRTKISVADNMNKTMPGYTYVDLEKTINSELTNLYCWPKASRFCIHIAKTELMISGPRQKFLVRVRLYIYQIIYIYIQHQFGMPTNQES